MTGGNPPDALLSMVSQKIMQQVQLRWKALCSIVTPGPGGTNGEWETVK